MCSRTELGFRSYFRLVSADHDAFMLLYGGASRRDQEFSRAVRRVTNGMVQAIAPLIAALVVACVLLAPSIILGYAVKAAERDDRERGI